MKVLYTIVPIEGRLKPLWANFRTQPPQFAEIKDIVEPILGGHDLERVRVFWEGIYTDMFVAERGVELGLKENPRATDVYLNNVKVHLPPSQRPAKAFIYGPAVLFKKPVWF